jgi:addiction module HigA family antidote
LPHDNDLSQSTLPVATTPEKELTPFVATHPGEMIKDELKERGMTQKQLAEETGIKTSVLSETINGKRSVSLSVAVALEKALDIPADVWMNMQTQYDLDKANIAKREEKHETVSLTIPIKDRNLLKELVRKFGWACVF